MDDPWANAWGETPKPVLPHPAESWDLPSLPPAELTHGQEADIAMPSWATGAGIQWDEPTDSHASLWTRDSMPAAGWEPEVSPYESIPIGHTSLSTPPLPQPVDEVSTPSSPAASPPPVHIDEPPTAPDSPGPSFQSPINSPPSSPLPRSSSAPGSPDAFGTFETALDIDEADVDPWSPAKPTLALPSADADAWGGASWGGPESAKTDQESEAVDEWEAAKQQKEKQDRHVPPELLASILQQFEEISGDLWPQTDPPTDSKEHSRSGDIVEAVGIAAIVNRIIPQDLVLPPYTQFSTTFTRKHMNEALRLTRNLPVTRSSPMTKYMVSKGSTSWEAFVKSQPDVAQDDVAPSGWRVIEKKDEEVSPVDDAKKKTGGGLLSFFGRKTASTDGTSSARAASPSRPPSTPPVPKAATTATPRGSIDVVKSRAATPAPANAKNPSPTASSFASTSENKPPEPSPMPAVSSITSPSQPDILPPAAPPSAVSRFLGRFSRGKSSSTSPRDSIALSSDDLEFLSDIVPSASDDPDHDHEVSLGALTSMIQSSPLPTKLPAPLAPPPRPPPLASPSRQPQPPTIKQPPQKPIDNDDFAAFFSSPPVEPRSSTPQPTTQEPISRPMSPTIPSFTSHPVVPQAPKQPQQSANVAPAAKPTSTLDDGWPAFDFDFAAPTTSAKAPPATHSEAPASRARTPMSQSRTSTSRAETPPVPAKRTVTAIMSNKPTSHSASPSLSGFSFPSPPSPSRPQQGSRAASQMSVRSLPPPHTSMSRVHTPLPPPPTSRVHTPLPARPISPPHPSHTPVQPPPLVTQFASTDDDDDFSDFLSSPAEGNAPRNAPIISLDSSFASAFSDHSMPSATLVSDTSHVGFDDFDDFVSSPLRTPSPPRPPAKPPAFSFKPPPPSLSLANSQAKAVPAPAAKAAPRRPSRAADHQRTLSLLETAAARGKWPAPPSPLPEAIPPPEPPRNTKGSNFDIFGGDTTPVEGPMINGRSTMQAQQANAMASLAPSPPRPTANGSDSLSQWKFPMPTNSNVLQPAASSRSTSPPMQTHTPIPGSFGGRQSTLQPMTLTSNPTTPASGKTGGLSAQDLSFFEGL